MELKEIISIAGMSGLFKIVAQTKGGIIVESLTDNKRTVVSGTNRVSTLSDVSVFASGGDIPLAEVFLKMKEQSAETPAVDPKAEPNVLREYFQKVVPSFDKEKVYNSDIKKIVSWYDILKDKVSFEKVEEEKTDEGEGKINLNATIEKSLPKIREAHGPKEQHAKIAKARTRKKV